MFGPILTIVYHHNAGTTAYGLTNRYVTSDRQSVLTSISTVTSVREISMGNQ